MHEITDRLTPAWISYIMKQESCHCECLLCRIYKTIYKTVMLTGPA